MPAQPNPTAHQRENNPMEFTTTTKQVTRIVIQNTKGWSPIRFKEIWEYRELLYFLVLREIQGRYRQTALGLSWLFLRPVINVLVLTLAFGQVIRVPSDGIPYPLFSMTAMLPWSYFSGAVTRAAGALLENMNIISKVYFPRLLAPLANTTSALVDFTASFIILGVVMLIYRQPLRVEILLVPIYLLVAYLFALAVGLWLATLSVRYRDVAFAVNFLLQALMYASPVIYPVSMIPERWQWLYNLNPMSGVIQGFRWSLLGSGDPPGLNFLISVGLVIVLLITGASVFNRTERTIVDLL
jgi:lipopolysaccharide transport system permease protein